MMGQQIVCGSRLPNFGTLLYTFGNFSLLKLEPKHEKWLLLEYITISKITTIVYLAKYEIKIQTRHGIFLHMWSLFAPDVGLFPLKIRIVAKPVNKPKCM